MSSKDFIKHMGGAAALAERLGWFGGVGRITNWYRRGIPARVLLEHEWLRRELSAFQKKNKPQEATP